MTDDRKRRLGGNPAIHTYTLEHSLRETDILKELREETTQQPMAVMQIPPEQGQFMALLAQLIGAKRCIEIGVFTGYSALAVAQALPDDGYLLACDVNEETAAVAQRYWERAGVAEKIDLKIAPAIETLEQALNGGQTNSYDMAFIDADKPSYDEYYELCLQLLRPGGLLLLDNMLLFGAVLDGKSDIHSAESVAAIQTLNKKIHADERVEISMLAIADGLTFVRKR